MLISKIYLMFYEKVNLRVSHYICFVYKIKCCCLFEISLFYIIFAGKN